MDIQNIGISQLKASGFIKQEKNKAETGSLQYVDSVKISQQVKTEKTSAEALKKISSEVLKNKVHVSNAHTRAKAEELLARRKDGITEEVIHNSDKRIESNMYGVPDFVKSYNPEGVVFRHYFKSREVKEKVLSEGYLLAGSVPYVQAGPHMKYYYPDLKGVFFTKPGVQPEEVGVPGLSVYADFMLPADTAVLEIEPGKNYLVPGEPALPAWLVDYYLKYKNGGVVPDYVKKSIEKIEKEGGIKEPTKVYFQSAD